MLLNISLEEYLNNRVKNLNCREDTSAYIINTLCNYKNNVYDFQNKSLTLEFAKAKFESSFKIYNELADHILFMETVFKGSLNGATTEYYYAIAQSSYFKCHILMNRSWILYEELADRLPELITQLQNEFNKK